MSNISNIYNTGATSDNPMNVFNSGKTTKTTYSEDKVTISQEAKELTAELRYKKNLTYVTSEQDVSFDKVATALPSTTGFKGMLDWLGSIKGSTAFTLKTEADPDRNAYMKDPKKYATMWENMYEQFDKTLSSLGITQESEQYKEIIGNQQVSNNLLYKFSTSLNSETKSLLGYFNIQI